MIKALLDRPNRKTALHTPDLGHSHCVSEGSCSRGLRLPWLAMLLHTGSLLAHMPSFLNLNLKS